jgi:2-oxo-4-hydroxy-4-carboxy-5-ureidoimidazoline decarboxylase
MSGAALERLNGLEEDELVAELRRCFDSEEWARDVAGGRPYADVAALLGAVAAGWQVLSDDEWERTLLAFREPALPDDDAEAMPAVRLALELYRQRFSRPFVSGMDGATADELLMLIRIRLGHDELAELRRSRDEYRNLARRRLARLLEQQTQ